ncbi:MAG TPA: hypothetical protein VLL54_19330 [Pyrinomonadaceae bacterium]|nr:hypothetical protein [Pyrinomonadaceae bacterium]
MIDIGTDTPTNSDEFLVDTNVWALLVYTRMTSPRAKVAAYSSYVNQALTNGSILRRCGLTFAEIAHLIEKTEREIYQTANPTPRIVTKEFRHNLPIQRANVVSEIQSAWAQIKSMGKAADVMVTDSLTDNSVVRIQTEPVDGYDLFLLEASRLLGVDSILTDDGDYCSVANIRVFTRNRAVIEEASNQGKLVVR